jgi:hypothetical protein
MKIAGACVENKRLAPSLAIFMLRGAPKAHEVLPEKWNQPKELYRFSVYQELSLPCHRRLSNKWFTGNFVR